MNFNSIYDCILNKLTEQGLKTGTDIARGYKQLQKIIVESPELTQQYYIYDAILNANQSFGKEEEIMRYVQLVEDYCAKLNGTKLTKANLDLCRHFNINPKNLSTTKINEAIDDMIDYHAGNTYRLTKGVKYRKTLLEYLQNKGAKKQTLVEQAPTFGFLKAGTAAQLLMLQLENRLANFSNRDRAAFEAIVSKDYVKLSRLLTITERYAQHLEGRDRLLIEESVKKLRTEGKRHDISKLTYMVFDLLQEVETLVEGKFGGSAQTNMRDLTFLKKITMSTIEDKNRPSQILLEFEVLTYPKADKSEIANEASNIDKTFRQLKYDIKRILTSSKFNKDFDGDMIWDTTVPTTGVKAGKPIKLKAELYVDTHQREDKDFNSYAKPAVDLLVEVEKLLVKAFGPILRK